MTTSLLDTIPGFRGVIHSIGSAGYDEERRSWNTAVDARPATVAVAADADDVVAAVKHAAAQGSGVTVQATGHGTQVPADGTILLRTGHLNDVRVDPERQVVRVGAGARWDDVVAATAPFGLAPPAGVGSVGAVGFTVGGGAGPLARWHGLAADNVVAADVVTADGRSLRVGPDEHPDLFWALRGGGGSFAVVTALELRLHQVDQVWSGLRVYDVSVALDLLAAFDAWAADPPADAGVAAMITTIPEGAAFPPPLQGRTVIGYRLARVGGEAGADLQPLFDGLGEPLLDTTAPMSFADTYATAPPHEPTGIAQHFGFVESLTDGVGDEMLGAASGHRVTAIEIRHWGGVLAQSRPDGGATGALESPFSVLVASEFGDPARQRAAVSTVSEVAGALRPYETGRTFLNFVSDPADVPRAFAHDAYARLVSIKRTWDSDDVIKPGIGIRRAP